MFEINNKLCCEGPGVCRTCVSGSLHTGWLGATPPRRPSAVVQSDGWRVTHCLHLKGSGGVRGLLLPSRVAITMPCLKEERFLLLEHSVTVGPQQDVDALVARIGQALQLGAPCSRPGHPTPTEPGYGAGSSAVAACGCVRGRSAPYALCAPRGSGKQSQQHRAPLQGTTAPGKKQLCGRGWTRAAVRDRGDQEDPHRLLQELLLSGNLIKEAVRRLQLAASCTVPETVQ